MAAIKMEIDHSIFLQVFLAAALGSAWVRFGNRLPIFFSGFLWLAISWVFDYVSWSGISNALFYTHWRLAGDFILGCLAAVMFGFIERRWQQQHQR